MVYFFPSQPIEAAKSHTHRLTQQRALATTNMSIVMLLVLLGCCLLCPSTRTHTVQHDALTHATGAQRCGTKLLLLPTELAARADASQSSLRRRRRRLLRWED